jgi:hypothetical protein
MKDQVTATASFQITRNTGSRFCLCKRIEGDPEKLCFNKKPGLWVITNISNLTRKSLSYENQE